MSRPPRAPGAAGWYSLHCRPAGETGAWLWLRAGDLAAIREARAIHQAGDRTRGDHYDYRVDAHPTAPPRPRERRYL